jgi:PAS domain S-box-containing protein
MVIFLLLKLSILFNFIETNQITRIIEFSCFVIFSPLFYLLMKEKNGELTNNFLKRIKDSEEFIATAAIISITDEKGKITYVNKKFEDVSGWSLNEVKGKDHNIVNSGLQPDGYWGKMYETVMKGEIWNDVVTNKTKSGELYYVDTYIRARFDKDGKLEGFSSIRQDVNDLKKKEMEIRN